ncbi:hypothetical protein M426DRAFT_268294 [Hypoxylon sp. CI-4A]|nr:hypothetical protein M426DRAFT_268294 [Hypoxylon sp. CI-4A]
MPPPIFDEFTTLYLGRREQVQDQPALEPPLGITPNFDNPPNRNVESNAVLGLCLALSTFAVFGRLCMRFFLKELFLADSSIITAGMSFRMTIHPGAFVHQWDMHKADLDTFVWDSYFMTNPYIFSIAFIKVAILLEWIHIFVPRGIRNILYWASHSLIWANILFCAAILISYNPTQYGDCGHVNSGIGSIVASTFNLVTDVLVFLIPQKAIWKLHMSNGKKLEISVTFAVGILCIAAALARLVETIARFGSPDFTYTFSSVMLTSNAEVTCAFLVICIPALMKVCDPTSQAKVKSLVKSYVRRVKLRGWNDDDEGVGNTWWRLRHKDSESGVGQEFRGVNGSRLYPTSSTEQLSHNHPGPVIYRTTHFEMTEFHDPNAANAADRHQYGIEGIL